MEGRSIAPAARVAASLSCVTLAACVGGTPARIVAGEADTVVVNNRQSVPIPARLLDADGRTLRAKDLRWRWVAGDHVPITADGRVSCARPGDAEVRVSQGRLSTRVVLRCRPVAGFYLPERVEIVLGGAPVALPVRPVGVDDRPVTLFEGRAGVRDSAVAVMREGRLVARRRGMTDVDVQVGDCTTTVGVAVVEQTASAESLLPYQEFVVAPLRLVGGELRIWRLSPGRYTLRLDAPANASAPVLAAAGANCAPYPAAGQHYQCVASGPASVVVRHRGAVGTAPAAPATLRIRRLPDAGTWAHQVAATRARDACSIRLARAVGRDA